MTNSTLIQHFLNRSIGWDNLFDSIATNRSNFPPYNIVKSEDDGTEIQLALAGYSKDDIEVSVQDKVLTISSSGVDKQDDIEYNYRGVAKRAFTIKFSIGQYQEVKDVSMKDGMLFISFETVLPEDKKLKTFTIN
tara:strand:- start:1061 stop:1465 length:405 start_codon:yes stop_codon:yes gene_type:complete